MKLSTRGRYGARLMLDLALRYGEGPVPLKEVAGRQEISEKYLGQLIPPLKTAGLIKSSRGAHGGYLLARAPGEITLAAVVQAVEGSLSFVECVSSPGICKRAPICVTHDVWREMSERVVGLLESITMRDMVDRQREKDASGELTYEI